MDSGVGPQDSSRKGAAFSVIITAYNCADTLHAAVMSVLPQLGENDEVIIVDDASTDATVEVAREFARGDGRVSLVRLEQNRGRTTARCEGVSRSRGGRVLFLDADDTYHDGLIAALRDVLRKGSYDVIHFGLETRVLTEHGAHVDETIRFYDPYPGELLGREVFEACFTRREYLWNLVNKCFDGELCRRACRFVPPYKVQRGDDAYLYFVISYFADSYLGLEDTCFYTYNLGAGQETLSTIGLGELREFCESADAFHAMEEFLEGQQDDGSHAEGLERAAQRLARNCAYKIKDQLGQDLLFEGLQVFSEAWGAQWAIGGLARAYGSRQAAFFGQVRFPDAPHPRPEDTILSFWAHLDGSAGSAQRALVECWRSLGLRVVLVVEHEPSEQEAMALGVEWRLLPIVGKAGYEARFAAWESIIDEFDAKGIVYNQWLYRTLGWDMTVFKARGIAFFIHRQGTYTHYMAMGDSFFSQMPWVLARADGVVCANDADAAHCALFNARAFLAADQLQQDALGKGAAPLPGEPGAAGCAGATDAAAVWERVLCSDALPEPVSLDSRAALASAEAVMDAFALGCEALEQRRKKSEDSLNATIRRLEKAHEAERRQYERELKRREGELQRCEKRIAAQEGKIESLEKRLQSLRDSTSYRLGRATTAVPRKLRDLFLRRGDS